MTIYLFAMHQEQKFKVKHIHDYARDYMLSWFPKLPSYEAFNMKLIRLSEVFRQLSFSLLSNFQPSDCLLGDSLLDSLPIITCSGKRSGKVAREITDKGFYSTNVERNFNSQMLTPVKGIKGQSDVIKMRDKAANDLYSSAVSVVRQPIESLFNWLIEKTDIQRASKVRSTKGLLVHVSGRIVAAYIFLIL